MRKVMTAALVCMMLFAQATSVHAAEISETCYVGGCKLGECFMDTDCDGICGDHYFVDENKDGICDNHCYLDENEDGICDHFVDENADGVCDHCHDHGKPVQSDSGVGKAQNSDITDYRRGHHGRHHSSRRSGRHHSGHC